MKHYYIEIYYSLSLVNICLGYHIFLKKSMLTHLSIIRLR
ncbi:hypothetical protein vBEcoMRo121lw_00044 [Escherichia phage vB_EcoM-Ro121lw]|uniref:Uncharacterized protein n=2 Tax=Phapecoctavirus TaxID=2733124 RepID=A0A482N2E8_9CAUD|nr:hypothetical protein HOV53_gp043 [Escherichia phage vB_EcoM_Schickermooser]AXA27860.1 hypothetical protein vBEcoMRo121lw_00044 [Escherichia phage vB_EcoM-Ro121lw]QBQ80196.1 hypothetical protein Schickermooser_00043 [Escherichia phage vB_EcoM_Schickermooser]UJQ43756.1 hypothetical protein [Escherichia phage dw-ec]